MNENTVERVEQIIERLELKLAKITPPDNLDEWGEEISPDAQRIEREKYIREVSLTQGKIYALQMLLNKNGRW